MQKLFSIINYYDRGEKGVLEFFWGEGGGVGKGSGDPKKSWKPMAYTHDSFD